MTPSYYLYRCLSCGLIMNRYRNSTLCRKCRGSIERLPEKQTELEQLRLLARAAALESKYHIRYLIARGKGYSNHEFWAWDEARVALDTILQTTGYLNEEGK